MKAIISSRLGSLGCFGSLSNFSSFRAYLVASKVVTLPYWTDIIGRGRLAFYKRRLKTSIISTGSFGSSYGFSMGAVF
jgi:hypothetical protein